MAPQPLADGREIGYRSYNRMRNVGDAFTSYVLRHLTKLNPAFVSHEVPHLLAIGSIFFMANHHSRCWGTGILNPGIPRKAIPAENIFALRGQKTLETLRADGITVGDIPLGDPGIFAAEVMAARNVSRKIQYKAAVIPHHDSSAHPSYQRLLGSKEIVLVEVMDSTLRTLELILQSELVISQSLHGLIFAESLGKPAVWVANQDNPNWNFKFADWYSTTSNPRTAPVPLSDDVDAMVNRAERCFSTIDKKALAAALPIQTVRYNLDNPLSFEMCRAMEPVTVAIPSMFAGIISQSSSELLQRFPQAHYTILDWALKFFDKWSERTYICLQPNDESIPVTQPQLRWMCALMDRDLRPSFAYIVSRRSAEEHNVGLVETGHGVAKVEGTQIFGGALLLRPDFGGPSSGSVTFVV